MLTLNGQFIAKMIVAIEDGVKSLSVIKKFSKRVNGPAFLAVTTLEQRAPYPVGFRLNGLTSQKEPAHIQNCFIRLIEIEKKEEISRYFLYCQRGVLIIRRSNMVLLMAGFEWPIANALMINALSIQDFLSPKELGVLLQQNQDDLFSETMSVLQKGESAQSFKAQCNSILKLRPGFEGPLVSVLKSLFASSDYFEGYQMNDIYCPQFADTIRLFQMDHNLAITGEIDPQTIIKISRYFSQAEHQLGLRDLQLTNNLRLVSGT